MSWNPAVGVPMFIIGVIVLVAIWLFGQPKKPGQGRRLPGFGKGKAARKEPGLGEESDAGQGFSAIDDDVVELSAGAAPAQGELDVDFRAELERLGAELSGAERKTAARKEPSLGEMLRRDKAPAEEAEPAGAAEPAPRVSAAQASSVGRRPADQPVDRIVTLYVVARDGDRFRGSDLVVAAEKAGLDYGDMSIFHRLQDGKPEAGPVFSVANMVKPGNFDMNDIHAMDTPGVSFFMTLPGPMSALDAWDAMLPTAQRMAELLDGLVLDDERNALGRQRVAYIRDDLRGWDRRNEGERIEFGR
ncbi:cell division protein ZipA [Oleiagrimonas sp. C23AA]|uniref:cell division protein ZipA n=1 Tax=Oleiagrimonas sp. C23AA TaxID=2719047 RepID=UPI001424450B|nr:cell division protein ZipA [Oleiagrimonas sp. C23AA]NII10436.1 cell division protein ZipA [Oleiagrimonas sp. C23AA]